MDEVPNAKYGGMQAWAEHGIGITSVTPLRAKTSNFVSWSRRSY